MVDRAAMHQVNLKGMLEFTAGCGFLFAISSSRDLFLYGIACVVLAIWSLRISRWTLRWLVFNWMLACGSIFFGLACLEQAFLAGEIGFTATNYWLFAGCALIVWTPLAVVNGFLFLAELSAESGRPAPTRHRRDATA